MVKYGKEYRKLQLPEWKKYYLNYKTLKRKIKDMKQKLFKHLKTDQIKNTPDLLKAPLLPDNNENEKTSIIYQDEKGEQLKEFVELLIQEFKKSYSFFIGIEKVLIKKMNEHLYTQTNYSTYSLLELSKEMKKLSLTVYLAKCLNAFINDIMTAIKKILKKFDKNFSKIFGVITPHLIEQLLSKNNSEFEYILQFKVIDQIITIAESNIKELKKFFDQNNDSRNNADNAQYRDKFLQNYEETLNYIRDVDQLVNFKTQYKDWADNTTRRTTMKKGYKFLENDIFNPILSSSYYKDNLLQKFLSTKEAFAESEKMENSIGDQNKRNMILIFAQTFFCNSLISSIFPILYYYVYARSHGDQNFNELWFVNLFLFAIVLIAYFAQYLSIFFFYNYTSRRKIKFAYLLSYIFVFIGSILYCLSIISGQGHFKVRALILGISRILIGLGSNPILGKKYITIYAPRHSLPTLSKVYLVVELLGFISGPSITALLLFIPKLEGVYYLFNCIGFFGTIGSIILFILFFLLFTPPQNDDFLIVKNIQKGDNNSSASQSDHPNFEDVEDSQDKEFYKLQKEKKDKKNEKSRMEGTKSDEIKIEINDNEFKTNKTNKTSNISINSDGVDDREDNDYYKIMENAGDNLGRNEIVENIHNNIDKGRFSELEISNEQNEDIKNMIDKLFEYQESSNFTYINMMPRTLDDIILKEQKTFGYMNRNLLIMMILLLFNNLIKENLIVHSSYYMLFQDFGDGGIINQVDKIANMYSNKSQTAYKNLFNNDNIFYNNSYIPYIFIENNENVELMGKAILEYSYEKIKNIQTICFLSSGEFLLQILSLFFIMPFYKINIIFKKNLIILMIMSIIFMIPLSIGYCNTNIWAYTSIVSIDLLLHKVIEIICSCYLVYLIPPKWQFSHIRASSLPIYLMIFGKIFGCLFCLLSFKREFVEWNYYFLTATTVFVYGLIGLFIYKSKNFRVRALSRIVRNKALE